MTNSKLILHEIRLLKNEVKKSRLYRKRIYTLKEAAEVIGVSYSQIQKLVSQRKIPHSKPTGKLIFIKRRDLEKFIMSNYIHSDYDVETNINTFILNNKLN